MHDNQVAKTKRKKLKLKGKKATLFPPKKISKSLNNRFQTMGVNN